MMIQINNFVIVIIIRAINSKSVVIFAAADRSIFFKEDKLTTFSRVSNHFAIYLINDMTM